MEGTGDENQKLLEGEVTRSLAARLSFASVFGVGADAASHAAASGCAALGPVSQTG